MPRFAVSVAVFAMMMLAPAAMGEISMSLLNAGESTHEVTIDTNGATATRTFSVDIVLDISGTNIFSSEANLAASHANLVEITGFAYNGADWDTGTMDSGSAIDAIVPNSSFPPESPYRVPTDAFLAGATMQTMGRAHGRFGSTAASMMQQEFAGLTGRSTLATLTLQLVAGTPEGDYSLNVIGLATGEFGTFQDVGGTPGEAFVIHVVPDPSTLTLLVGGSLLIFGLRRRG